MTGWFLIRGNRAMILRLAKKRYRRSARIFQQVADFPAPIGLDAALLAIGFSGVVGPVFGGYSALRASRLSPIEALGSE